MRPLAGPTDRAGSRARLALGFAVFAAVVCASYAVQRLVSWAAGEAAPGEVLATRDVGFYWRVGLSTLHGLVAGLVVGLAVGEERARTWLGPTGWVVAAVVVACAVAMVLVP